MISDWLGVELEYSEPQLFARIEFLNQSLIQCTAVLLQKLAALPIHRPAGNVLVKKAIQMFPCFISCLEVSKRQGSHFLQLLVVPFELVFVD